MQGNNLTLRYFVHNPNICDSWFLGTPTLGRVGEIHVDTIALAITGMAIVLVSAALIVPRLTSDNAGGMGQNILELYYQFIANLTKEQMGDAYKVFLPLIAAIFCFVLLGNFLGVGPWKALEAFSWWPLVGKAHAQPLEIVSPTTDFNVTFGLATVALITYIGSGFWAHGIKYLKMYLNPIEWLDLLVRPSTLALRLMVAIGADELLRVAALSMAPMLVPIGVMSFELFIGVIQAFVFALLTTIYIGMTVSHH
jgi:F-type H+-transporting ATPase subunit a